MPKVATREYRAMKLATSDTKRLDTEYYVEGYATTFNDPYVLYEDGEYRYVEEIAPEALNGADMSDVIMQYDHQGRVMARQKNGTLMIEPDAHGLFMCADLSKTDASRGLYTDISEGLVDKMSWAFVVNPDKDEYREEGKTITRIIHSIRKVYDVSAVSIPADPGTEIQARSAFDGFVAKQEAERLKRAADIQRLKLKLKLEGF